MVSNYREVTPCGTAKTTQTRGQTKKQSIWQIGGAAEEKSNEAAPLLF